MKPWKTLRSSVLRWCTAAILGFGLLGVVPAPASADVGISYGVFYDSLAPYGEWLYVGHYGRVWRPRVSVVGLDFRPYASGGHWVYTDYGWSFESDYEWGWAPFHYGRWLPDPEFGWVWVPDTVWAPAWVDWRYGDGYIGWAPLAPVGAQVVIENYYPAWCFVPTRHFLERDFYHHAVPIDRLRVHFAGTVPIRNQVVYGGARWYAGPPAGHVAAAIGQPIHPAAVAPPRPGAVQPVRAGAPTVVSVPAGGAVGARSVPSPAASVAHPPAPNWTAGRAVNPLPPVGGASAQAPVSAPAPRLQPGWGAKPAPAPVSPPAGRPTPQSRAPEFQSSAPSARFIAPAPQPRSTFVQSVPPPRPAPSMPMIGRPAAAPRAPSFGQSGMRAPAPVVAPRAMPTPVAVAPPGPAAPSARGIPAAKFHAP